jgi:hypothetical protein
LPTNTVVNLRLPTNCGEILSTWTSTRILLHGDCYRSMEFIATHVSPRNLRSDRLDVKSLTQQHSVGRVP